METTLQLLLLEDNPEDAALIQLTLKRAGIIFSAIVASDETEFLEALKENKFHAVLADNALPQYNSMEALELVRATNPHVAFILVTGTVSEEFAVKVIKQGADDYILKTNLTRLPSAITGAVQKKQIKREKDIEKEFSLSIINSLPGIFFLCDNAGNLLQWNKNFEAVLKAALLNENTPVTSFFQTSDIAAFNSYIIAAFKQGLATVEAGIVTTDGAVTPYYFTGRAIHFGEKACLINVGIDISATRASEKKLQLLNIDLHRISIHLENLKEQEQARIAREVHDQLGQLLTGLKMDIAWVRKHTMQNTEQEIMVQKLNAMNSLMDEAIQTVRRVASDLRPPILDDYGLTDALEWKGVEFETRSGIRVYFHPPDAPLEIESRVSTGLYRIYQEILTNIARHAEADSIVTKLTSQNGNVILAVTDNGKGFDVSQPVSSLGLLGMKERSYMIGGSLDIKSKPGAGTMIIVTVPLRE